MLVLTSRDFWAPTQELDFGRYPSRRGWTLVRDTALVLGCRKYDEAKQVRRGLVRFGVAPPVTEESDHSRSGR